MSSTTLPTPAPAAKPKSITGFSLVELSIVLVILGLLVGGILGGQSLIRASELRSVTTQHAEIVTAFKSFRDKYIALPGDIANATSFWGVSAGNGNGDNIISSGVVVDLGTGETSYIPGEIPNVWTHLKSAGLTAANVNPATSFGAAADLLGKMPNSGWITGYSLTTGHYLSLIHVTQLSAILRPEELWNIDKKVDDGRPGTGAIMMLPPVNGTGPPVNGTGYDALTCITTASLDSTSEYQLTSRALSCNAQFLNL